MQSKYSNTIEKLVLANESLKELYLNDFQLDEECNKAISIELFFLAFSIFEDYFKKIEVDEVWKNLFAKQDYYLEGDKIVSGNTEIPYDVIEMTFLETMLKYREKAHKKVLDISCFSNINSNYKKRIEMPIPEKKAQIIFMDMDRVKDKICNSREKAIRSLFSYEVSNDINVKHYLDISKREFRRLAYDGIASLYNRLKKNRKEKLFNGNLPLVDEKHKENGYVEALTHLMVSCYPIQFYAKDKECIDYSSLLLPNIEANANHYRYDDVWEEFEEELERINKIINTCKIVIRNRKVKEPEKKRVRFRINQLEWKKRRLEEQYVKKMIDRTDMREVYDEETGEFYYTGRVLNKHILYNIEVALKNGHVDIVDKNGKYEFVFYAIVDKNVDFILTIDAGKLKDIFDSTNLVEAIEKKVHEKRMISQ